MALGVKNPSANAGILRDMGSICGLGRSPGEGNGNSLQYSCLENLMNRGAWQTTVQGLQRINHDWVTKHTPTLLRCIIVIVCVYAGFPGGASGKEPAYQCRPKGGRFNPWVRKIPWRRKWQLTPVFFPGESHGQWSLVSYSLQGHKKSDMTEMI